uniref:Androgen-dependent TFPI-regulating protein n=1 Tax=Dendroctonus ponderosae TaxID=77166 RepID=J3JY91_DENPD|nr:unknown [Dendroctonus ponderosae]
MSRVDSYNRNVQDQNVESKKKGGSLASILLYGVILGFYLFTIVYHSLKLNGANFPENPKYQLLIIIKKFSMFYFTIWNFILQIIFLLLAIVDEVLKLANISRIQSGIEKIRLSIFPSLVFPSGLIVACIFWGIWHIDRELIFPKTIDEFYPPWMNHALHTFIIFPLIIEVISQFKYNNVAITKKRAAAILILYCAIYQTLYLSVYFLHGFWLYPIYKILTWSQRVGFIFGQIVLALSLQQLGFFLVNQNTSKLKAK